MALRLPYTDPDTGAVQPLAHMVIHDPVMRADIQEVTLKATVWATKADKDAGNEPIARVRRVFTAAQYAALRTSNLNLIEPALIAAFFPTATRVAD